jgi:hypothetical protein
MSMGFTGSGYRLQVTGCGLRVRGLQTGGQTRTPSLHLFIPPLFQSDAPC